jgi:hypothetical protein
MLVSDSVWTVTIYIGNMFITACFASTWMFNWCTDKLVMLFLGLHAHCTEKLHWDGNDSLIDVKSWNGVHIEHFW